VIADAHTDLLLELDYREHRLGETDVFARTWLPLLEAGGVALQVCPVFVELEKQPEGALRAALAQATSFHTAVRENQSRVVGVRTASDLEAALAAGRLGLVLSLEGVEQFGYEVWPADAFWELGVRMASLTWNRRNPYADGVAEGGGGLSLLGGRLVDRLVELGVILDLAHASPATFADVLARSGDAPVLVSHAACRSVNDHPRNLTDEQLEALAERDGLFGIMLHPIAIDANDKSIGRVLDHVEHAISVMGSEHVCLGGDFVRHLSQVVPWSPPAADGLAPPGLEAGSAIEGVAGPEEYPALVAALHERGLSGAVVDAITHRNLLGLLRRALPT
jgi:membrane dipeptidase